MREVGTEGKMADDRDDKMAAEEDKMAAEENKMAAEEEEL